MVWENEPGLCFPLTWIMLLLQHLLPSLDEPCHLGSHKILCDPNQLCLTCFGASSYHQQTSHTGFSQLDLQATTSARGVKMDDGSPNVTCMEKNSPLHSLCIYTLHRWVIVPCISQGPDCQSKESQGERGMEALSSFGSLRSTEVKSGWTRLLSADCISNAYTGRASLGQFDQFGQIGPHA